MFRSILVGTDGSDTASEAVRRATALAKALGAKLHVVSGYKPVSGARMREDRRAVQEAYSGDVGWVPSPGEDVEVVLRDAVLPAREAGVQVETHARTGDPAEFIVDLAEELAVDLIVVGNKGMQGARRFLLNSVPNKVSHNAPCSVLIVSTT